MVIKNKRAGFEYKLEDIHVEAGIALTGAEVKSVKSGRADISNAQARILKGEAWLVNANIPVAGTVNYSPTRSRKLLLHRTEIVSLESRIKQQKLTFVPISMYTKAHLIKVRLSLGKPKRKFEKRQLIKKKDLEREVQRQLHDRGKY